MPSGTKAPDRVIMVIPGLRRRDAKVMALLAVSYARTHAPKLTGVSSAWIRPLYGNGNFGMQWFHEQIWFQNTGVRPFLMSKLAGKTVPMWIDDPNGDVERQEQESLGRGKTLPANRKRVFPETGRKQVLIFRKAAKPTRPVFKDGKLVMVKNTKQVIRGNRTVTVPRSYPGAPGRIDERLRTATGKIGRGNIGVRWYFPGLTPRNFLQMGLVEACDRFGVTPGAIHTGYGYIPTLASVGDKIPDYTGQPMAERMNAMARKRGASRISSN
jgi:hypothetical protein